MWNLPEYSTGEETNDKSTYIPDGKVLLKVEKDIFIIEHTVCWSDIREARLKEKENKYVSVRQNLRLDYPDYKVTQVTTVMDSLGGYSDHLVNNIGKLLKDKQVVSNVIK